MAILPRGATPSSPLRAPIQETNLLLATRFANQPGVTYLDIGAKFLAPDGSLPAALMPDGTHPSEAGYRIWADALVRAGVTP
jgi:lysophospholipase L1-like esterase